MLFGSIKLIQQYSQLYHYIQRKSLCDNIVDETCDVWQNHTEKRFSVARNDRILHLEIIEFFTIINFFWLKMSLTKFVPHFNLWIIFTSFGLFAVKSANFALKSDRIFNILFLRNIFRESNQMQTKLN